MKTFPEYREEFPITRNCVFFNNAAVSSPPTRVADAVGELFRQFSEVGIKRYPQWMQQVNETRSLFARLINAEPLQVCFTGNTSDGLSAVASGLEWKSGDRILLPYPDFPANVYPWLNLEREGVQVDFFPKENGRFQPEDIEKALRPGTRLLAVSSNDFSTGFLCDLEALGDLCRRKELLLCVDGIQSLGAVPMDVKKYGIHFLASGGHKWLLSTMGIGALYIAEEANPLVRPVRVGWRSVENEEDFYHLDLTLKRDARRFEPGTLNISGITALGVSLGMLLEIGIEKIHTRILEVTDLIAEGLAWRNLPVISPVERKHRSGIISFVPRDAAGFFHYCLGKNVMISQRGDAVRLSPHFYSNEADVEAFFTVLDEYLREG